MTEKSIQQNRHGSQELYEQTKPDSPKTKGVKPLVSCVLCNDLVLSVSMCYIRQLRRRADV